MHELSQRFSRLYAGVVYDAMRFDLRHKKAFVLHAAIKPAWPFRQVVCGPAFTCKGERVLDEAHVDDRVRIEMFRSFTAGCVQVIDTGGDDSVAHFGDISGKLARKFGAVGAVVDGNTRDVRILEEDRFPIFTRGVQPIDAFGRWQIVAYQEPIQLSGIEGPVQCRAGDLIFGDPDGVLCVPAAIAPEVLARAEARLEREDMVRAELRATDDVQSLYDRIGRW